MSQIDQAFFPPRYWQQFEELTLACFRDYLRDPHAARNGRSGYPQAGVDVYGHAPDGFTGVQCKQAAATDANGRILPGGRVTKSQLLAEIAKAETFKPRLDVFILATTGSTNPSLQRAVRDLNEQRVPQGGFRVVLWFWEDYLTFLNTSHRLQSWFYRDVLQILNRNDEDISILEFFAEAFDRPAFQHPLSIEDPEAFPQAVEDTQTALRTGHLYDRRTRTRIRQSLGWRRLTNPVWRDGLSRVDKHLADLRIELLNGIKVGQIVQTGQFMDIRDRQTRDRLETLRQQCVDALNNVLIQAQLNTI